MIVVSNLNAEGKGSLREAIEAAGPRIIVFEAAGVIDLGWKSLHIRNPSVTIAGQTAPSPGITLIRGGISITTHEVIIQHLKVRPGDGGRQRGSGTAVDAISTGKGAYKVIIDHCSASWGTDENITASGPRFDGENPEEWRRNTSHEVTISHCIIANGLNNSVHEKFEHSKGTLIHDNATGILLYGNLYANNVDRHPLCKGGTQTAIVNNMIFNPVKFVIHYARVTGQWKGREAVTGLMSVVGNYIQYGPDSPESIVTMKFQGGPLDIYWKDNEVVSATPPNLFTGSGNFVSTPPVWPEGLKALPAKEARDYILKNAGAFPWDRDEIDRQVIADIRENRGRIIDSQSQMGGYPIVKPVFREFRATEWNLDTMTRK